MPLKIGTSEGTLVENFRREKHAGKDDEQAWAIAYETRRRARRGKKRKSRRRKKE